LKGFPEPIRILDVGGAIGFWKINLSAIDRVCEITLLNLEAPECGISGIKTVAGDARRMSCFHDKSFDVVFSNSVIEHVGTFYDQMAMAREIQRVCHAYFVQTPNRYFPIEPHFLVPFWQFFPISLRARLLQHAKIGWVAQEPNLLRAKAEVEQIRLLSNGEMQQLFPTARIENEKLGPFTKSLIAIGDDRIVARR
jgi:hypothetical protein